MNRFMLFLAILCIAAIAPAQQPTQPMVSNGSVDHASPDTATSVQPRDGELKHASEAAGPSYPNTSDGLEKMMMDMISMQKRDDKVALAPFLRSLVLPDAEAWFSARFGNAKCGESKFAANECLGPRQALSFERVASNLPDSFALTLNDLAYEGLINFEAVDYAEQCAGPMRIVPNPKLAGTLSTTVLLSRLEQRHEPIYALWSYSETKETLLAFFVYSAGAFRYLGILHEAYVEEYQQRRAGGVTQSEQAASARYLSEEQVEMNPVVIDPEVVQRTVVLMLDLGKDGEIKNASYLRGPVSLRDAAINIAKKKRFDTPEFGPYGFRPNRLCFRAVVPK